MAKPLRVNQQWGKNPLQSLGKLQPLTEGMRRVILAAYARADEDGRQMLRSRNPDIVCWEVDDETHGSGA